jgi:hypothetical protein
MSEFLPRAIGFFVATAACIAHGTLDLTKFPPHERLPRALSFVLERAQHDFHDLRGAKKELVKDGARQVWYDARPPLPGATECRVEYRDDIYACEWRAANATGAESIWQDVTRSLKEALAEKGGQTAVSDARISYHVPAQTPKPPLRVELRRLSRRVIEVTVAVDESQ